MDLRVFVSVGAALGVLFLAIAASWSLMRDTSFAAFVLVTGVLTLAGVAAVSAVVRRMAVKR